MDESREQWLARMIDVHGLDEEDIIDVVQLFFQTYDQYEKEIQEAHACDDTETLRLKAHAVRGAANNMGFSEVGQAAAGIENTVRAGEPVTDLAHILAGMRRNVDQRQTVLGLS